jgi:AraC-like DNA-binding protein
MKEVAYACGFSDRAQFTKFFKERFGIAPQDLKGFPKSPDHNPATSFTLHTFVSERIQQRQPEEQS